MKPHRSALALLACVTISACASPGSTPEPTSGGPIAPESPVTAEETGLFEPAAIRPAVEELGISCEGGWNRTDDFEYCIDITSPGNPSFAIYHEPDYDVMTAAAWTGWEHGGPYTAVWNESYGFMYPDSWAGEWVDPIVQDCMAGLSDCYMQTGENYPALLNE